MIAVTAHSTAMPFLVRIANRTHFLPTTSVFMMEVLKLIFCLCITLFKTGSMKSTCHELHKTIWKNRLETIKVAVPAVVYAIQNNLYYIALANIDPTTYSVTLQLRILTTAALSVCLLNKKLSWYQWGAQVMALLGVVIVQLDKTNTHKEANGHFWIGVSAVIGMCWTSAFAGRMFEGWSKMVWLVTILNSVGGLCISLVMKYADNVMKTYCQSIAIGLTSLVSIFLGERLLTVYLVYGVLLVTSSVAVYSLFPASPPSISAYQKLEQQDDVEELMKSSDEDEEDEIFGRTKEISI
uniref:Nucleotide-sugar transporter family protein n=1 Tax=Caenorhabditis tropicalis TaxID=1561998 RepID=A0A1I7UXH1_9PELO